jgi:hypothetical protein|nr:MAG TPA: hypothetical protein [Caudoviricetes sp.]
MPSNSPPDGNGNLNFFAKKTSHLLGSSDPQCAFGAHSTYTAFGVPNVNQFFLFALHFI